MKAMRAKFFHPRISGGYEEIERHIPNGRYWKMMIEVLPRDRVLVSDTPHGKAFTMGLQQVVEFYCQGVGEDEKGQYYHYYSND